MLKMEKLIDVIVNYVADERKSQAILLDGEWGCGKTFFVKEHLLPALNKRIKAAQIYEISLYGISNIEKIQEMIYAQWLEKHIDKLTGKIGTVGRVLNKGVAIFGKPVVSFLENKLEVEDAIEKMVAAMADDGKQGNHNIIIFDDVERCRVDIIELMGFLNNLSENNGFKLILVANEKEISRIDNPTDEALKYLVVMKNKELATVDSKDCNKANVKNPNTELKELALEIFGEGAVYKRTREKLIGLTVPYSTSIPDVFEEIVKKFIHSNKIQIKVIENKEKIAEIFEENNHKNLRTLISSCIAIEDIVSVIDEKKFFDKEMLDKEIDTITEYCVFSAIRNSKGQPKFDWPVNTRYMCINQGLMETNHNKIYGYAFVDEYWKTFCVDDVVVVRDVQNRIIYCCENKKSRKEAQEYKNLALFKLQKWYLLEDEKAQELIQQVRTELEDRKYLASEFKEIICTLMRINNKNFGLGYDGNTEETVGAIYDSEEADQFIGMTYSEEKELAHSYVNWSEVEIPQFVDLMVLYFDNPNFLLTNEMIRMLSEDKGYVYRYRVFTEPLRAKIKEHDLKMILNDEIPISDIPWDDSLRRVFKEKKTEFLKQKKFLTLFDYSKITEHIMSASAQEIHCFCDAVKCVYSFSNLAEAFAEDLEMLDRIISFIDEEKKINPEKSRTKEIAFRRFTVDLKKYRKKLKSVGKGNTED